MVITFTLSWDVKPALVRNLFNKPDVRGTYVHAVAPTITKCEHGSLATIEELTSRYRQLQGEYHINIDKSVEPVQHTPHKVPVVLRSKVKEALDGLVHQDIIAQVTHRTPWISSMVVVPKKNGELCICLNPRDLN